MRKYGVENFTIEVIDRAETEIELCLKEIEWISTLGTFDRARGYNSTTGGDGTGSPCTPEVRAKISAKKKGRPLSPVQLAARRANPPNLGAKRTEEQRKRISEGIRKSMTQERREALSRRQKEFHARNPRKGRPVTEEMKIRLAEVRRSQWASMTTEEREQRVNGMRMSIKGSKRPAEEVARRAESIRKSWTQERRVALSERSKREGVIAHIHGKLANEEAA